MQETDIIAFKLKENLKKICNYQDVYRKSNIQKISTVDLNYLMQNESIKEMLGFYTNRVLPINEIDRIRDRIKQYMLHSQKIEKKEILIQRKKELEAKLIQKKKELNISKNSLIKIQNDNLVVKEKIQENKKKHSLLNTKMILINSGSLKTNEIINQIKEKFNLENLRKETSNDATFCEEIMNDFMDKNMNLIDEHYENKDKEMKRFPELEMKDGILNFNFRVISNSLNLKISELNDSLNNIKSNLDLKTNQEEYTINDHSSIKNDNQEKVIQNYNDINTHLNNLVLQKQKKISQIYNDSRYLKENLRNLIELNNDIINKSKNVFNQSVLNAINVQLEDLVSLQIKKKVFEEKAKIDQIKKNSDLNDDSNDKNPSKETQIDKDLIKIKNAINLVKKHKNKIDNFIKKHLALLSPEIEENYGKFQNSLKAEFNLFYSFNQMKSINKRYEDNIYSFNRFIYDRKTRRKLRIFNKADIFNKANFVSRIWKTLLNGVTNDNKVQSLKLSKVSNEIIIKFNKLKCIDKFYDETLSQLLNDFLMILEKQNEKNTISRENLNEIQNEVNNITDIGYFLEVLPDKIKNLISLWNKTSK